MGSGSRGDPELGFGAFTGCRMSGERISPAKGVRGVRAQVE